MDKIKKIILAHVPVTTCNLKCDYCYITQKKLFDNALPIFKYSAKEIRKGLSYKRMGGPCYINLCGGGETLLPPQMLDIIYELADEGHYLEIVTNGLLSNAFINISQFPKAILSNFLFKFSFHYKELLRLNKMDEYFANVNLMRNCGASITVELTTFDNIISEIDNIKNICIENIGAPCHLTVGRDDRVSTIDILTDLSINDYKRTWGVFDSNMFEFKLSTYYVKRKEFCYAGDWLLRLNIGTGIVKQCYKSVISQNIFDNPDLPINIFSVGNNCQQPHCYNSHALLTLGIIPELNTPKYTLMRDRFTKDGHWLTDKFLEFYSSKLVDSNAIYSRRKQIFVNMKNRCYWFFDRVKKLKKIFISIRH